jgi:hypothetical protein
VVDDVYDQILLLDVIQLHGNGLDDVAHDEARLIGKPFSSEKGRIVLGQYFSEDNLDYYLDKMRNRLVQL